VRSARIPVLVVDDLPSFRRSLSRVVAVCEQFELVGEVASGEEALAFVAGNPVDVVLMDVRMPGMGGIPAAEQLRHHHPEVLVVLLSVRSAQALSAEAAAHGALYCAKERFGPDALDSLWRERGGRRV
jgi:two-component system, NarL family, invasion response regulator UvrY